MSKQEGLKLAKQKELDLIEVAPKANPPVCKIMSWSKYKYELTKKKKEQRKNKSAEQKEMRFKVFIQHGDLEHKLKKVKEFLNKKHPVKLQIRATGRATKEHMDNLKNKILTELEGLCEVDPNIKKDRRNINIIIRPNKTTNKILKKDHGEKMQNS